MIVLLLPRAELPREEIEEIYMHVYVVVTSAIFNFFFPHIIICSKQFVLVYFNFDCSVIEFSRLGILKLSDKKEVLYFITRVEDFKS